MAYDLIKELETIHLQERLIQVPEVYYRPKILLVILSQKVFYSYLLNAVLFQLMFFFY